MRTTAKDVNAGGQLRLNLAALPPEVKKSKSCGDSISSGLSMRVAMVEKPEVMQADAARQLQIAQASLIT